MVAGLLESRLHGPALQWCPRCAVACQAGTQARGVESFDGGTGAGQAGECTARAEIGARRSDHRSPKKSCGTVGYPAGDARQRRRVMMDAVVALAPTPGLTASACAALNVSRASVYRQRVRLARPLAVRY